MTISFLESHNKSYGCCDNDTCINLKISATTITTAITAVTLLGGILLLLAKQGVPLGGINTIAAEFSERLIYGAIGASVVISIIQAVVIFALAHNLRENHSLEEEERNNRIRSYIKEHSLVDKLPNLSYWKLTGSNFYAFLAKDKEGAISIESYKTRGERASHLQWLIGYKNGKKEFKKSVLGAPSNSGENNLNKPLASPGFVATSPQKESQASKELTHLVDLSTLSTLPAYQKFEKVEVEDAQYYCDDFPNADGKTIYALLYYGEPQQRRYFESESERNDLIEKLKETHYSFNEFIKQYNEDQEEDDYWKWCVKEDLYVRFKYELDQHTVYVAQKKSCHYVFRNQELINSFVTLHNLRLAPSIYVNPHRYNPDHVIEIITAEHRNHIEQTAIDLKKSARPEFIEYHILTELNKDVYVLIYNEFFEEEVKSRTVYFDTPEARRTYFENEVSDFKNYTDPMALHHFSYGPPPGMQGPRGIVQQFHLNELLLNPKDSYLCKGTISNKDEFLWFYRKEEKIKVKTFDSAELREKAVQDAKAVDYTRQVEKVDHSEFNNLIYGKEGIIETKCLDKIVVQQGDYWLEAKVTILDVDAPVLFYHDGIKLQTRLFFGDFFDRFSQANGLQRNVKQALLSSIEYPELLGRFLADQTPWKIELIEAKKSGMNRKEYLLFGLQKTQIKAYPEVFTALVRDENGLFTLHFFKNANEATIFWKGLTDYINTAARLQSAPAREG